MTKDHLGNKFSCEAEMCEQYGIPLKTYQKRLKLGWNKEQALTRPVGQHRGMKPITDHIGNHFQSISDMARFHGMSPSLVAGRLKNGWSVKKALTQPIAMYCL